MAPRSPAAGGGAAQSGVLMRNRSPAGSPLTELQGPGQRARSPSNSQPQRAACAVVGLVASALGLSLGYRFFASGARMRGSTPAEVLRRRALEYCGPPAPGSRDAVHGQEGRPAGLRDGARLLGLLVAVRHGDRSAIHGFPGHVPPANPKHHWRECGNHELANVSGAQQAVAAGKMFRIRELGDSTNQTLNRPMSSLLSEDPSAPKGSCAQGQLTARGFEQHLLIGQHLRRAYASEDVLAAAAKTPATDLYVRTTDYARTRLSASALLMGMLGWDTAGGRESMPEPVDMWTESDDEKDVMLGQGFKTSSKASRMVGGKEAEFAGGCIRALELHRKQEAAHSQRPSERAKALLAKLFGRNATEKRVTDAGDAVYSAYCADMPLPCGTGGCVDTQLALQLVEESDRAYQARFDGSSGGRRSTQLAFYALLKEVVLARLRAAADRAPGVAAVTVLSGHDTVIAPLLSALGAYDRRWPPLASRVVFELWGVPDATGAIDGSRAQVRLLYNGRTITGRIPVCAPGGSLCPLRKLEEQVASALRGYDSLKAACKAHESAAPAGA